MKLHLAKAEYPHPVSRRILYARYVLVAIFVLLVLAQLFAFEKMGATLSTLLPGLASGLAKPLGALIVALEVATLPSLLVMALSPLARLCSRLSGPLVMVIWYVVVYCGMLTARLPNTGLLGSEIHVSANFLSLLVVMILFAVTVAIQYIDTRAQANK